MKLLFICTIVVCSAEVVYWNPFEPVLEFAENESRRMQSYVDQQKAQAKEFIDDQSVKITEIFEDQRRKVTETLTASYDNALKMKQTVNDYFDNQKKAIADEWNNYVEAVREGSRKMVEPRFVSDDEARSANPDAELSVPGIVTRNGYVCETHTVISEGYLLNIHRIPKNTAKTVILQHGVFASSADWVISGKNRSLAYILSDNGYDVWMSNARGNRYSNEHAWLRKDSKSYWNFSWHDIALYDIPSVIDYIRKLKGDDTKITYIGHSMGSTILFTMLSLRPEYNAVLSAGFALAPVVYTTEMKSPVKDLAPIASNVAYMQMMYGAHEFTLRGSALSLLTKSCDSKTGDFDVCKKILFYICGSDDSQFNKDILPVFLTHFGSGVSWKTIVHYSQEILSGGRYQMFDYGKEDNKKLYGNGMPPKYDLSKVTAPIKLFWAENDLLSNETDVLKLYNSLNCPKQMYKVPHPEFNHLDYLYAVDVHELLNKKILDSLEESFR